MSNKDRGNIKWDAIMLPEHVEMLKDVFNEEEYKEKPILDEQQIMEINATLQNALENDLTVQIKYFADHDVHIIEGKLLTVDLFNGYLSLDDEGMTRIAFDDLLDVTII